MRHGEAGIGTALAGLGAAPAVIHVVLAALGRAASACLRAQRADGLHVFTAPGNRGDGELASGSALQIQRDATRRVSLLDGLGDDTDAMAAGQGGKSRFEQC